MVVGAGGAGLRAAIEAKAKGARTAVVCKSLLGKAHTVMAEGGVAAALAVTFPEDTWRVALPRHDARRQVPQQLAHGADPRAGGARARPRARGVGRRVRPHARRPHRPAPVRRAHLLAPRAHGRPHRPRDDPHAPGPRGRTRGSTSSWRRRSPTCSCTGGAIAGAARLLPRTRASSSSSAARAVVLATGGIGKAWTVTSNSWEYTARRAGPRLPRRRRPHRLRVRAVPPDGDGVAAEHPRRAGHRGRARRGRHPPERDGRAVHVPLHARDVPRRVRRDEEECRRWVEGDRKKNRRPPELLTRDVVARAIRDEVREGRGSPHGGVFLDISYRARRVHQEEAPVDVPPVQGAGDVDITKEPMEVGPTMHYHMGGVRVNAETAQSTVPGLFAAGEVAGGDARREPPGRQLALRPPRLRPPRGPSAAELRREAARRPASRRAEVEARDRELTSRRSSATRGDPPLRGARAAPEGHERRRRHRARRGRPRDGRRASSARWRRSARDRAAPPATACSTPAGTSRSTCAT